MPAAAGVRDQPDLAERLNELGAFGCHNHVTCQRQVGARPRRDPIDGADHREVERPDQPNQRRIKRAHSLSQVRRPLHFTRIAVPQILPGAEPAPGTCQQNGSCPVVPRGLNRCAQGVMHLFIKAVQAVGPVQGDFDPVAVILNQNRFRHRTSPSVSRSGKTLHRPTGWSIKF